MKAKKGMKGMKGMKAAKKGVLKKAMKKSVQAAIKKKAMKAKGDEHMGKATKAGVVARIKAQGSLGKKIMDHGEGPFDKEMILAARRATRGAANHLVSMDDARQIFEAARPAGFSGGSTYDTIEKKTMAHIRKKWEFTP